jgi:hypothetical protein
MWMDDGCMHGAAKPGDLPRASFAKTSHSDVDPLERSGRLQKSFQSKETCRMGNVKFHSSHEASIDRGVVAGHKVSSLKPSPKIQDSKTSYVQREALERIISLIFEFAGLASCHLYGVSAGGLQGLRDALTNCAGECATQSRSKSQTSPSQRAPIRKVCQARPSPLGLSIGDPVQIWSNSLGKWFDDGKVQDISDTGALFVRYNQSKPSGKWIPIAASHRLLRKPSDGMGGASSSLLRHDRALQKVAELNQTPGKVGIFTHCVVFISHLGGTCMTSRRKQLIINRIQEGGGASPDIWNDEVTHLVVVPEVLEASLQKEYGEMSRGLNFVAVVTDLWVCNSLVFSRRLPERDYLWHSTRRPPEEVPPTPPPTIGKRALASDMWSPEAKRLRPHQQVKEQGNGHQLHLTTSSCSKPQKYPFKERDHCCSRQRNELCF